MCSVSRLDERRNLESVYGFDLGSEPTFTLVACHFENGVGISVVLRGRDWMDVSIEAGGPFECLLSGM